MCLSQCALLSFRERVERGGKGFVDNRQTKDKAADDRQVEQEEKKEGQKSRCRSRRPDAPLFLAACLYLTCAPSVWVCCVVLTCPIATIDGLWLYRPSPAQD